MVSLSDWYERAPSISAPGRRCIRESGSSGLSPTRVPTRGRPGSTRGHVPAPAGRRRGGHRPGGTGGLGRGAGDRAPGPCVGGWSDRGRARGPGRTSNRGEHAQGPQTQDDDHRQGRQRQGQGEDLPAPIAHGGRRAAGVDLWSSTPMGRRGHGRGSAGRNRTPRTCGGRRRLPRLAGAERPTRRRSGRPGRRGDAVLGGDPRRNASTNARQLPQRSLGSLARARAAASRSPSGSIVRSGGSSRWPAMISAMPPVNGRRPPRRWQYVTAREYWSDWLEVAS